jgi:hypothetical protein
VDSDPYGLPNWGRPLKGRVNSAPAKDNVDPDGLVSVKAYPTEKSPPELSPFWRFGNIKQERSMIKAGLDGVHHHAIGGDIAWRHYWLTNVMVDGGKSGPARLLRREMPSRKESLSRRLHKLRLMRAALDQR